MKDRHRVSDAAAPISKVRNSVWIWTAYMRARALAHYPYFSAWLNRSGKHCVSNPNPNGGKNGKRLKTHDGPFGNRAIYLCANLRSRWSPYACPPSLPDQL